MTTAQPAQPAQIELPVRRPERPKTAAALQAALPGTQSLLALEDWVLAFNVARFAIPLSTLEARALWSAYLARRRELRKADAA